MYIKTLLGGSSVIKFDHKYIMILATDILHLNLSVTPIIHKPAALPLELKGPTTDRDKQSSSLMRHDKTNNQLLNCT